MQGKTAKAMVCVILGNVIWGFGFLFTRIGLTAAPDPNVMLAHRFILSTLLMTVPICIGKEKVFFKGKDWKPLGALLLMQIFYYVFESYGILYTNATIAGLVLAVVPVVTIGTEALFLRTYPTRRQAIFCIMPVAGVIIMTVTGKELGVVTLPGILFLLLTMLASAGYKTANRKAAAQFSSFERTYVVLALSAVVFSVVGMGTVKWDLGSFVAPLRQGKYLLSILCLSALSSIVANLLVNYAAGHMSAFKLSSFGSLSTLCTMVAGVVFLKEPISVSLVLGAILILLGIRQVTKPTDFGGTHMKKKVIIAAVLAICLIGGIVALLLIPGNNPGKPTHMILNKDQSYGGSLSVRKYGKGAPLNGQYDVEDSPYYIVNNDFYNMSSTEERIIIPQFASYQQTMQDSSGLACLVMILNYMGQDVQKQYTELKLMKQYEKVNGTKVYGNGTTEEGLINLVENLNLSYTATNKDPAYRAFTKENTAQFFQDAIKDGKFVLVRYESPVGYGWKVVIGYDDLGNVKSNMDGTEYDSFGDDVIIFAEPYDGADHHQDGYATERAQDFFAWWNKKSDTGVISELQSYVIIDPNLDITYDLQPVDETPKQTLYENHLPRNPDGTYGGTRDADIYGGISSGNGWWDHLESNYYKINDFYNMGSEGSRVMLSGYTVLQQTMSSSCGVCAVNSVLTYYGAEGDPYEMEESYTLLYEELNRKLIRGNGSSVTYHKVTLADMGYNSETFGSPTAADPIFPTLESYMEFMRSNLLSGKPVVLSTYLGSGHFLTVIGVDDMGTDYIYDDVIITADSCDYWDGHQDGYNVFSAYKFYRQHTNSKHTSQFSCMVIEKP